MIIFIIISVFVRTGNKGRPEQPPPYRPPPTPPTLAKFYRQSEIENILEQYDSLTRMSRVWGLNGNEELERYWEGNKGSFKENYDLWMYKEEVCEQISVDVPDITNDRLGLNDSFQNFNSDFINHNENFNVETHESQCYPVKSIEMAANKKLEELEIEEIVRQTSLFFGLNLVRLLSN